MSEQQHHSPKWLDVDSACRQVQAGNIIAYPTEAVYGLGCDPRNNNAVNRLRLLKQRDTKAGFICIASRWSQVEHWVLALPAERMAVIFNTWPGPHTWIFPASTEAPHGCIAENNTIALRITAHPLARTLCDSLQNALVSTSANPARLKPARTADEVFSYFDDQIAGVLVGEVDFNQSPSSVRDAITGRVLR